MHENLLGSEQLQNMGNRSGICLIRLKRQTGDIKKNRRRKPDMEERSGNVHEKERRRKTEKC